MRLLKINTRAFWYCPYLGKTPVYDGGGYETGEYALSYGDRVCLHGNVSPAKGEAQIEQFGNSLDYDKVIIIPDPKCPMDEYSVLFLDKSPEYTADNAPKYDYIVKRVARSLNYTAYAVSKVTTT